MFDVAILCANYNNANYLNDFFLSIERSSVKPKYIIFVDDFSNDESLSIIKENSYNLDFKIISLNENVGFANALNVGIDYIFKQDLDVDYILRVDPDDLLSVDRIEKQVDFLISNPDVDIVGSNVSYFIDKITNGFSGKSNYPLHHDKIVLKYINASHGLCHGSTLFRKSCFLNIRYRQEYVPSEEYDIFTRMISEGFKCENLKESLTFVRTHRKSVSNNIKYKTVENYFRLRKENFGISYSIISVKTKYYSFKFYRKYINTYGAKRFIYLFFSSILNPKAVFERLAIKINNIKD